MKWLMLAIIIVTQQPAKSPEDKRTAESNSAQSAAHTKSTKSKQSPPAQSTPSAAQTPVAMEGQRSGAAASDHANPSSQQTVDEGRATQRKLTWFTGVLAGVGVLQLVVMFLTWLVYKRQAREMRRSRHEMRRQRHVMFGQYKAMRDQITQMEEAGRQTGELIKQSSTQSGLMALAGTHTEQLAQQAVRQSDLTQRQFDLANRPWICIDVVKAASNLEFRENGDVVILFGYQIRNVGHSVAQHISPWIEPIIVTVDNPVEIRARISEQLKKPIDSYFDHGKLIFPNEVITDRYPVMIRPEKLAQALDKSPFKDRDGGVVRAIGLEIFVCFDYQSTVDPSKHHQTQSMYLLSYRGNGMFLQSQKTYGMDGLSLAFKGFGAYAD
jgi:hypothetical protein